MKRIFNILAIGSAVVSLIACDHVSKFTTATYASFTDNYTSKTVLENTESVIIPVALYNSNGSCTVSFELDDPGNAKGDAFTIEPASGVLTFSGDETQNIVVKPINKPDEISGNITFTIKLTNVSGGNLGAATEYKITIADYVPVTWNFIKGTWHATDYDGSTYDVEIAQVDDTNLTLTNLWDGGETINGSITFDEEANTALISFAAFQVVYNHSSYGPIGIFGLTDSGDLDADNNYAVFAHADAGGITIGPWIALILTGTYAYYSFDDGGLTTLAK